MILKKNPTRPTTSDSSTVHVTTMNNKDPLLDQQNPVRGDPEYQQGKQCAFLACNDVFRPGTALVLANTFAFPSYKET